MQQIKNESQQLLGVHVENELMNYIVETPIPIGEKLPNEYTLAEIFGVGRSTIREAVKTLVSQGVLEVRRGKGTFVIGTTKIDENPLKISQTGDKFAIALDLCDARIIIEPKIAARAAKYASDEQIKTLEKLCQEVEARYLNKLNHIGKDMEFHSYIAKMANNQVFEELIPMITNAVVTFANVTLYMLKDETLQTHRAVVDAIKRHDEAGAELAMAMHLGYNRMKILELQEKHLKENENAKQN